MRFAIAALSHETNTYATEISGYTDRDKFSIRIGDQILGYAGMDTYTGGAIDEYSAGEPGFFWLCGQGGYGIQMAPGLATFATRMVDGASTEEDRTLMDKVSPDRF